MTGITRRQVLKGTVLGGLVVAAEVSGPTPARAKLAQASVEYRDHPNGDHQCSGCRQFLPKQHACKIVKGTISPHGWCRMWAPKA